MERPFDYLTKMIHNRLSIIKGNYLYVFEQMDKILVWMIGFALTGITLIISNFSDFSDIYSYNVSKLILTLLFSSFIFGLVYRIVALYHLKYYQETMFYLEGAFKEHKMTSTEMASFIDPNNINEILQALSRDFGKDYPEILEHYNKSESLDTKQKIIIYLKEEYSRLASWSKEEYDYTIDYIAETYKEAFGVSKEKVKKVMDKPGLSNYLKTFTNISLGAIVISMLSFICAILLLIIYI